MATSTSNAHSASELLANSPAWERGHNETPTVCSANIPQGYSSRSSHSSDSANDIAGKTQPSPSTPSRFLTPHEVYSGSPASPAVRSLPCGKLFRLLSSGSEPNGYLSSPNITLLYTAPSVSHFKT